MYFYREKEYDLAAAKNLKSFVKKYEWINSRYGEIETYTVSQAKIDLKKINKKGYLQHYKKEKQNLRKAINRAKKILGKNKNLVDFMQFIIYYRTHRTDVLNKSQYLALLLLRNLAKEKGLTY